MLPRQEPCDRRRLDLFLHNQLPEAGQRDLQAHVEFCPACRDNVDKLAGGERWWTEVRRYLGDDGAAQLPSARFESHTRRTSIVDLAFVRPSERAASPGRLGSYEVLEVVSRGAWGIVLKEFDPALHLPVAIWTEFVEIYELLIYRLAVNKGFQDAEALDLCQDVFRAVAVAIDRWDPDPVKGCFRAWLFRIARNLLVSFLAAQRRKAWRSGSTSVQELLEAQPAGDAEAEVEFAAEFKHRAFSWAAEQVKNEFGESTWLAFWQTGVEDKPVVGVTEKLGISAGAVYITRSRVLARLRDRVAQLTKDAGLAFGGAEDVAASGTM
jgi:RNA polymerase sigma factor (sigma-70 family)